MPEPPIKVTGTALIAKMVLTRANGRAPIRMPKAAPMKVSIPAHFIGDGNVRPHDNSKFTKRPIYNASFRDAILIRDSVREACGDPPQHHQAYPAMIVANRKNWPIWNAARKAAVSAERLLVVRLAHWLETVLQGAGIVLVDP